MNDNPNQIQENTGRQIALQCHEVYEQQVNGIDDARRFAEEQKQRFLELQQLAIEAEQTADSAYIAFKATEEITQALLFSEDQARAAMERSFCMDCDPSLCQDDETLSGKDMRELADKAEQQLIYRKDVRVNTQKEQAKLEISVACADIRAMVAQANLCIANERQIAAENILRLQEAEHKICFVQKESLEQLAKALELKENICTIADRNDQDAAQFAENGYHLYSREHSLQELQEKLNDISADMTSYHNELDATVAYIYQTAIAYQKNQIYAHQAELQLEYHTKQRITLEQQHEDVITKAQQDFAAVKKECTAAKENAQQKLEYFRNNAIHNEMTFQQANAIFIQASQNLEKLNADKAELQQQADKLKHAYERMDILRQNSLTAGRIYSLGQKYHGRDAHQAIDKAIEKLKHRIEENTCKLQELNQQLTQAEENISYAEAKNRNSAKAYEKAEEELAAYELQYTALVKELEEKEDQSKRTMERLCATADSKLRSAKQAEEKSRDKVQRLTELTAQAKNDWENSQKEKKRAQSALAKAKTQIDPMVNSVKQETDQYIDTAEAAVLAFWEQTQKYKAQINGKQAALRRVLATAKEYSQKEQEYIHAAYELADDSLSHLQEARQNTLAVFEDKTAVLHVEDTLEQLKLLCPEEQHDATIEEAGDATAQLRAAAEDIKKHPLPDAYQVNFFRLKTDENDITFLNDDVSALPVAEAAMQLISHMVNKYAPLPEAEAAENIVSETPDEESNERSSSQIVLPPDIDEENAQADNGDERITEKIQPVLPGKLTDKELRYRKALEESARIRAEEEAAQKAAETAAAIKAADDERAAEEARLIAMSAAEEMIKEIMADTPPAEDDVPTPEETDDVEQELRRLILSDMQDK